MFKRFSVRNLDEAAIEILAEIKAVQRREIGAILEDCIYHYWDDVIEAEDHVPSNIEAT
jgi:hypothetical protein